MVQPERGEEESVYYYEFESRQQIVLCKIQRADVHKPTAYRFNSENR